MHFQDQRIEIDTADRREIAGETKAEVRVEHAGDDVGGRQQQQRVTVGRRVDDRLGGDLLGGGTAIFDDERLAEPFRQHFTGEPRNNVGGAARRKTDQKMDRPRRIGVSSRNAQQRGQRHGVGSELEEAAARKLHASARYSSGTDGGSAARYAAARGSPPPGGGTGTPSAAYSLSLLRSVRIDMPSTFAAWVRLPRQCLSVSRIRSRSTSATVRPTSPRDTCSAANAACATAGALLCWSMRTPSGVRIASGPISSPVAISTARCMVFSSSRTLPGQ